MLENDVVDLPYCGVLGNIPKYFERIKQAETPSNRFSIDFLKDTLGFRSGNDARIISLLKAMKFIDEAGNPLQLYREFRAEPATPSKSIAAGMKNAYSALFARDRDIHKANEDIVKGHIVAVTDRGEGAPIVRLMTQTFLGLAALSDFGPAQSGPSPLTEEERQQLPTVYKKSSNDGISLTYTIVLNLPTTTTKEVYDTIFASLKENLLNN